MKNADLKTREYHKTAQTKRDLNRKSSRLIRKDSPVRLDLKKQSNTCYTDETNWCFLGVFYVWVLKTICTSADEDIP